MKKALLLTLVLILLLPSSCFADEFNPKTARFIIGSDLYFINERPYPLIDVAPYIKDGRTFVPLRFIAYGFEFTEDNIVWDQVKQQVTLTRGDKKIELTVGSKTIKVNDQSRDLDVAPEIDQGRVMVPLRFISEGFGADVSWDPDTRSASIAFY